eukprot:765759-Hanusia_phi.AAC.8
MVRDTCMLTRGQVEEVPLIIIRLKGVVQPEVTPQPVESAAGPAALPPGTRTPAPAATVHAPGRAPGRAKLKNHPGAGLSGSAAAYWPGMLAGQLSLPIHWPPGRRPAFNDA